VGSLLGRLGGYLPAAVALAIPTVFLPYAEDSFILPRVSIVVAGACLGVGLALLAPRGSGLGLGGQRWPLAAAALAALLAFAFSISWPLSFAGSYSRYESLPVRLAYLGLFATAVWLPRDRRAREWVPAALVLGTSIACVEAIQEWAASAPFRPDGNLGNANLLAALVAMALPLGVARGARGGRFAVAWWIGVVVMAGGLWVTTSRSGVIGALTGCIALIFLAVRGRYALAVRITSGLAVVAALLGIVASPLRTLNDDPPSLRLHLWQDGLRLIAARPLTGWGEDATGLSFGKFLSQDYASLVTFDRVHSGPLDVAATQGLVGLAASGLVLLVLARAGWRQRHRGDVGPLIAACVGYTVWVLFNFDWAPVTGIFWLLAGTAWSGIRHQESTPAAGETQAALTAAPTLLRSGAAVLLALAAIGMGAMPLLADVWYLQGRADLSVVADPLQARYHWGLGQELVGHGSLARGVDQLLLATDLGETTPALYVELGDRETQLGRPDAARNAYRRALEIDPYYTPASDRLATLGA
jgi:O-antigen ligase